MVDIPLTNQIEAEKEQRVHPYFTAQPNTVVSSYIKHFTQKGDIVLDPMSGTGVTGYESLKLGCKAILFDLSPLAALISKMNCYVIKNRHQVSQSYYAVEKKCSGEINKLYEMTDIQIAKMDIPYWYPKDIALPKNADAATVEEIFTKRNLIALSILLHHIEKIKDVESKLILKFVLSGVLARASKTYAIDAKHAGGGDSSVFRVYRYWVPKKPDERNVWELFAIRFPRVMNRMLENSKTLKDEPKSFVSIGNALSLSLKAESIDYIYTDPPYGKNIAYLDLATMWSAWFQLPLSDDMKQMELIEGGDIDKTAEQYISDLHSLFPELYRVLKLDKWVSFVFAHKDPAFWDAIIKSAESAGFEYVNCVVQPSDRPSFHKINNPLTVLSGELIINFKKVKNPKSLAISKVGSDIVNLIKDSAELSIVQRQGATIEEIYFDLIPKLLESGLLGEVKQKYSDITPLLSSAFDFDSSSNVWYIKQNSKIGSYIPLEQRIKFYLKDFLHSCSRLNKKATVDDIVLHVMPKLKNGVQPTEQTILKELKKIALPYEGKYWKLDPHEQLEWDFGAMPGDNVLPELLFKTESKLDHNEIIYRITKLGKALGFVTYIGKKEQSIRWHGENFSDLSIPDIPKFQEMSDFSKKKIEQIDCIWFDKSNFPAYAFEIEHSTTITSGIDRFIEILKINPHLANKIVLVAPSSRSKKLDSILKESHYIGTPMYMENKLMYLFYKDVIDLFKKYTGKPIERSSVISYLQDNLHSPMK